MRERNGRPYHPRYKPADRAIKRVFDAVERAVRANHELEAAYEALKRACERERLALVPPPAEEA